MPRLIDADKARKEATIDLVVHLLDRQPTIDAVPVGTPDRFEEAFGSIAWYNGYDEWLWELSDKLKAAGEKFVTSGLPTEEWNTDKHALWMMLVSAFGNWGTSIRGGWIEKTKEAAAFIDEATDRYGERKE